MRARRYTKHAFPPEEVRRLIEPGPVVLVSSAWKSKRTIMTMGWHMVMEFSPSLIGGYVWTRNLSHRLIRASGECVINVPTRELATTVARIGNCSGRDVDKFEAFGLTAGTGIHVGAPPIEECYANLECRLHDVSLARRYSLFVFEVVHAQQARRPRHPRTLHYRGGGQFMVSGEPLDLRRHFRDDML